MQKRVLSLLVDNTAGVTTRVSGLFSRRGYNIDSITGGVTADERFSRITVVCSGDELILEQITNQLAKLVDVRDIKILEPDNSVCHELMMIKVAAKPEQRQGLISIADVFHNRVIEQRYVLKNDRIKAHQFFGVDFRYIHTAHGNFTRTVIPKPYGKPRNGRFPSAGRSD